jgi:putative nucleotidyltransferase with HDIG domain
MLLSLGLFAVLGGGALVYVISDTFTRPLGTLVEGVHALEQGDFTYPLAAIGKDEVARLTRAFEGMRNTLERNEAQRQQHVTELKQLHLGTLTALARAIDAKSHWTAGHSERVTSWAMKIASAMGLSEHELEIIHRGGLLHDVGKIGIPRAILDKRGKLTDEEVRQVREHVHVGARILEPIPGFAECMPIILQHHEWVDGSGYPEGLAGGEISLHARIFAVADCYDALISDRPYRSGMSPERVKKIIRAGVGKQFDPAAVETFLSLLEHENREEAAEDVSTSLVGVA